MLLAIAMQASDTAVNLPGPVDLQTVIIGVLLALFKYFDHRKGAKRDSPVKAINESVGRISAQLEEYQEETRSAYLTLKDQVTQVDHIVRGPDKNNGLRQNVQDIQREIDRIRHRLEGGLSVGDYSPPRIG